MTKKNVGRQIGGIFLSPDWIDNPELAKPFVRQIADMGYSSMIIFVRHQRRTVLDKQVHDAIKKITSFGHSCGLPILLDTDHCWWGPIFTEMHPETAMWAIRQVESTVHEGQFEFRAVFPRMPGQIYMQELSAVFIPEKDGYRFVEGKGIRTEAMSVAVPSPALVIKGQLPGKYTGKAVFYVALKTCGVVDVAHPRYLRGQEELLSTYRDIPLNGFTWDEPGKGLGDMSTFKAGAGFMALFKKLNGYELRPNLIYLDHLDGSAKAAKIRCDYYRTLVEMNYVAQKRHNDYATKIFGKNLIFGTHQTWSGFPTDLVAGCIDYFKLGKVLTAAWTDGGWSLESKYPVHNFMLAEGIKKELGFRDAYYNDWGQGHPAVGNMHFANRLKMLFHVNWFNHCISTYSEDLINFTQEPVRSAAKEDTINLDRFDNMLGDRLSPYTDVAYLYSWETMAATPKWMTRVFYTCIVNNSLHLVDKGLYAAIMGVESIRRAKIGKGCFQTGGFTYRVLIVPYANVLPDDVYAKITRMSEAGVPVIFVGPPPEFTSEKGREIRGDFAARVGFKPITLQDYTAAFAEKGAMPGIHDWEPSWLDVTYPLQATTGKKVFDIEGCLSYVQSDSLPLYYMPQADPREDLALLVSQFSKPVAETFAEGTYCRFFTDKQGSGEIVVLAVAKGNITSYGLALDRYGMEARPPVKPHEIKALFRLPHGELVIKGGTWCAVHLDNERLVRSIGDSKSITWNMKKSK